MGKITKRNVFGIIFIAITLLMITSTPFQQFSSFPDKIRLFQGTIHHLNLSLPSSVFSVENSQVVSVQGSTIVSNEPGSTQLSLKMGGIPIKQVDVEVIPEIRVIPGGQSIGVRMETAGVLVVGHHMVESDEEGISPAKKAGIEVGDMIVQMNGQSIKDLDQVSKIVSKAGKEKKSIQMKVIRDSEKLNLSVEPMYDETDQTYQIGLYIRDSASGVGTLTFYDPVSKKYGALGHVVSDMDTGERIIVGDGEIVRSKVTSIRKGKSGQPGQKGARFLKQGEVLGSITKNSAFGVFGKLYNPKEVNHGIYEKPIPIALAEQVKEGPAHILTVVEGQKVQKYDIEIVNVVHQRYPATKSMVIKITDPELLEKTGGIIQGMSGSPIIQNGKLVGAVTHVFVNDPTSGYGCFAEWMLRDAGYKLKPNEKKAG